MELLLLRKRNVAEVYGFHSAAFSGAARYCELRRRKSCAGMCRIVFRRLDRLLRLSPADESSAGVAIAAIGFRGYEGGRADAHLHWRLDGRPARF
jgi:hypothetical protein